MRYGYDLIQDRLVPESRIKVENMRADVLFLAVKDDDCWPSDVAVSRMDHRDLEGRFFGGHICLNPV